MSTHPVVRSEKGGIHGEVAVSTKPVLVRQACSQGAKAPPNALLGIVGITVVSVILGLSVYFSVQYLW